MSTDELADLREQGRALDLDVEALILDESESGGYDGLRRCIMATLNARFMRAEPTVKGPIALTRDDKEFLLGEVDKYGMPSKSEMVFTCLVFESEEEAEAWIAANERQT